ncbi:MAG: YHYH protein [Pirellulales bacterium]
MPKFSIALIALATIAAGLVQAVAQPPLGPPRRPPGGFGGVPGGPPPAAGGMRAERASRQVDTTVPRRSAEEEAKADRGLIRNGDLELASAGDKTPLGFDFEGDVTYGYLGNPATDRTGWGARFASGQDLDGDGARQARLSYTVRELPPAAGRWYRFRIRGLAQEKFSSAKQQLYLKAEFFADAGRNSLDSISQNLYGSLEQMRRDIPSGATGATATAVWRTYAMEFRTPFPEVDTLKLTVGFQDGDGPAERSEFLVDEVSLESIPNPAEYVALQAERAANQKSPAKPAALSKLVSLGGRWYYDPRDDASRSPPAQFDHSNADRLYYLTDRLEAPFADNTTAWLRRGYLDAQNKKVEQDRFVADNLVIRFTKTHLEITSHGLPNHPTAVFPDVARAIDGSPNYIRETIRTFSLPLEPKENPQHRAMTGHHNRNVMPPGPIGVAINGVVFFDPYDADAFEAFWRLDRCCGHPSPMQQYHYHKYPVCVKSPWVDDGAGHSPVIGFAFDGLPICGPYEAAGLMAKNAADNPLNEFNLHVDSARGPHYHVTPGKFPHVIGGHWGVLETKNVRRGM